MTTSVTPDEQAAPLVVQTVRLDLDPAVPLLDLLPARQDSEHPSVTWLRRGEGLVGWGVAAQLRTRGTDRFAETDRWWRDASARAVVRDEVDEPGTGLVAFGSFAFADEPGESVLTVPEIVVGRRGGQTWLTTASRGGLELLDRRGTHRGRRSATPTGAGAVRRRRAQRRAVDGRRRRRRRTDQRR